MSSKLKDQNDILKYQEMIENHLDNIFTVFEQRFVVKQKVIQALFEANNLKLVHQLRSNYMEEMKKIITQDKNISLQNLQTHHIHNKNEVIRSFVGSRAEGDQSFEIYSRTLDDSIEEVYLIYKSQFENKTTTWLDTFKEVSQLILEFVPIISPILGSFALLKRFPNVRRNRR